MAHANCTLDFYGYKHTLRICNTYCFFTGTVVVRTRLKVTLQYFASLVSCTMFLSSSNPCNLDVLHNVSNWSSPTVRYGLHIDSVIIWEGMSVLFCKLWPQLCCCYYCLNRHVRDLYFCLLYTRVLSVILNNISVITREEDSFLVTREGQQRREWASR